MYICLICLHIPCTEMSQTSEYQKVSHTRNRVKKKKEKKKSRIWFKILGIYCSYFSFEVYMTGIFDGKVMTVNKQASRCDSKQITLL